MTIKFEKEDALTCCGCNTKGPSHRLISLELVPNKNGRLVPTSMATLLCEDCLGEELGAFHQSLSQVRSPLTERETEESFLCRQVGDLVVPSSISAEESQLLTAELDGDCVELTVH